MQSPTTTPTPPVETFAPEGGSEHEVKFVQYPEIAYEGAVVQCGAIKPGRNHHAGSN